MSSSEAIQTGRSEPFSTEQNDEVYKRLVAGDKKARDEMIEGNMALVVYRVDTYLRSAPQMTYYRDDMISAGLVALCEAVDRMQRAGSITNPRPTGCITRAIDRSINHLVDQANTIVVPDRVQRRARAEGEPIKPPRTVSDKALLDVDDVAFRDRNAVKELQEEALACCQDDTEKRIVLMRAEGHTDSQISKALNVSRYQVLRRRKAISKRFYERCPEYILRKDRHKENKDD